LPYEVDGVLEIESINLKQPIIAGTSPKKLDISLNSMNEELKPGVEGNYSIAGHRSYTYGHHFNRLKEVKVDDVIKIITLTHTYYYKVTEVFLVLPNQISVLNSTPGLTEITLITCDPPTEATHRLIIKGVLEKAEEN
jgi:sortase A